MSDFYITQFPAKDEPRGRDRDRKRRTRWQNNDPNFTSSLSAVPKYLPKGLTIEQQEALATRIRIEELTRKMNTSDLDMEFYKEREPSPEPIYDQHGKRTNTREHRAKDKLMEERQILVEVAYTMNPNFKPPADYTPAVIKKQRKIYIPIEKFPDYNFIGLIIGPRGNTQKRMEKETGCKIAIRGKGSVKEGKTKAIPEPGADDKLHVLITADNEVQLDKATKLIHELLVPVEEGKNEWKRAQLRELAEINGTLRDRWWMHPSESIQTWDKANVKCEICGDASHPTSDCTFKGKDVPLPAAQKEAMASEYEKFMQEISGDGGKAEEMYDEFMSSISGKPSQASDQSSLPPWQQQGFMAPWQQGAPPAPWAQPPAGGAPWAQAYPPGYAPPPGSGGPPPPWQQQQPPTQ